MSDALTDISRDEDKQGELEKYFAALGYHFYLSVFLREDVAERINAQSKLLDLAVDVDKMPRGYFTNKSSLEIQTKEILNDYVFTKVKK
jgi:hypothetical protein